MDNTSMIAASLVAGLLSTMNVWVVAPAHIKGHLNDVYMAALMTAWMFVFVFALAPGATTRGWGRGAYAGLGAAVLCVGLLLVAIRRQLFVGDCQYLKGMIPHHSMAILMSRRILEKTADPAIRRLAGQIVRSQTAEIATMTEILDRLG